MSGPRPWWSAFVWDAAVLAVAALLVLRGNESAQHVGELLLVGAATGMYASRKPGSAGPGAGDGKGGPPIDPGLLVTLFGGVATLLRGAHAKEPIENVR